MLETGCYEQCAHANGKQPNLTAIEYKTEFSMWAISASPIQITTRIMNCSAPPPAPVPNGSVALLKQLSKAACVAGATFGLNASNATMWTTGGCRGIFSCDGASVTADLNGTGTFEYECVPPSGPVTCVGWLSDLQKEIMLNEEVIVRGRSGRRGGRARGRAARAGGAQLASARARAL
jgi:hypothetical protein